MELLGAWAYNLEGYKVVGVEEEEDQLVYKLAF
jgi:hypothetical protein